ncbi:MAG: hypothetical protein RMJ16_13870, partial [Thermoguttaceae bacterium]|nr:hypothetical protein [Thermoguttaceae bacterium]
MLTVSALYKILDKYPLPQYVKSASFDDLKKLYASSAGFRADPVERKYPCIDEVSTILSACLYFDEKDKYTRERQTVIENNFKKIASALGILEDYLAIEKCASEKKDDVFYAVTVVGIDGQPVDAFPIRNAKEAALAINYIWDHWREIAPEVRKVAATNILKYASDNNFYLDEETICRGE